MSVCPKEDGTNHHYRTCDHPDHLQTDLAIDWLMAVREFGIEKANEMFPEG